MIYIITPIDPTLKWVRKWAKRLHTDIHSNKLVYISPGDSNKYEAHGIINSSQEDSTIIFMGHGRSDALFGSKGKYWNSLLDVSYYDPSDDFYNDENFIDEGSYMLFKGKKLIILACNAIDLAPKLIESGAKAVMGFHRLPTSLEEFQDDWGIQASDHLIASMKGHLYKAFYFAVSNTCNQNQSFAQLETLMRFELQREIVDVLTSGAHYRFQLANVLSHIKKELKVFGNRTLRII